MDTWNDRSVGSCTYHVAHPGGMNPEYSPLNPLEAESRRNSRYWDFGYSSVSISNPGYQDIQRDIEPHETSKTKFSELTVNETNEYPYTLDLRNSLVQP